MWMNLNGYLKNGIAQAILLYGAKILNTV